MATRLSPRERLQKDIKTRFKRFRWIWVLVMVFFMVILVRLCDLQVVNAHVYQMQAQKLRSVSQVAFNRGRILDKYGVVLAQDSVLYDIYVHPRYFYKNTPQDIATQLAPILKKTPGDVLKILQEPYDTIRLASNVPKEVADQIHHLKLQCIDASKKMIRRYPQGHLASHILGYVNDDARYSSGVEKSAEKLLHISPLMVGMEHNGRGDYINVDGVRTDWITDIPKAQDVQLTIDARVQYAAETALAKGLAKNKAKRGAVVIMDPRNGEILAFAANPDFDPEQYYNAAAPNLKNWAISDVYPPGSTFKILTVACGLETGVINKDTHIEDTGLIKMNGFTIKNHDYAKRGALGNINLAQLFQHSSNIASLKISLMMDPVKHYNLLRAFGVGQLTHLDIPGESAGIIHAPDKWDPLTHATIGFGYGLASTPIQMAAAVSTIANNGVWVTPHVLKNATHIERRRVISVKTAQTVSELLAEAIEDTKNSTVKLEGFRVAGKTGTSLKPSENGRGYSNQLYTSFVGFYPQQKPQVLIMVVVDSPSVGNAWGATVAGPIFKEIADQTTGYLGIKPVVAAQVPLKTAVAQ